MKEMMLEATGRFRARKCDFDTLGREYSIQ